MNCGADVRLPHRDRRVHLHHTYEYFHNQLECSLEPIMWTKLQNKRKTTESVERRCFRERLLPFISISFRIKVVCSKPEPIVWSSLPSVDRKQKSHGFVSLWTLQKTPEHVCAVVCQAMAPGCTTMRPCRREGKRAREREMAFPPEPIYSLLCKYIKYALWSSFCPPSMSSALGQWSIQ